MSFELFPSEKNSALWMRLKGHIEERITVLRARNDGDLGEIETAKLRGRIAAMKEILALEAPKDATDDLPEGTPSA